MSRSVRVPARRRPFVPAVAIALALVGAMVAARQGLRALGVDLAAFDRTVRPQDDFNRFVNGTWMRTTEIPPDRYDQGSKSDGDGNLRNWFSPNDLTAFQARTSKLAAQFAAYAPIDDLHINGQLTLGENIGDLSGLAVAFRAYRMSLGDAPAPVIEGFTGDQRFFLGWAQVWRTRMRDDALRQQLLTNPHSPGHYRAFVPLTNLQAFYDAWDVRPGDGMYRPPDERAKIW